LYFFFFLLQDINLILNLAAALEKAQISSFRFDFSGNGYVSFDLVSVWIDLFLSLCKTAYANKLTSMYYF